MGSVVIDLVELSADEQESVERTNSLLEGVCTWVFGVFVVEVMAVKGNMVR